MALDDRINDACHRIEELWYETDGKLKTKSKQQYLNSWGNDNEHIRKDRCNNLHTQA